MQIELQAEIERDTFITMWTTWRKMPGKKDREGIQNRLC